jgi:hypothetical protein
METSNYDYHFVSVDSNNKNKYNVLKKFILTDNKKIRGQYISSMQYQDKYSIDDDLKFYIICNNPNTYNRELLQNLIHNDINNIYNISSKVYEFNISCSKIKEIYNKLFEKLKKKHYQHFISEEFEFISINNDCKLKLHMIITEMYINDKKYLLNNPCFELL